MWSPRALTWSPRECRELSTHITLVSSSWRAFLLRPTRLPLSHRLSLCEPVPSSNPAGMSASCCPRKSRANRKFVDSLLEGDGFELLVPRHKSRGFPQHSGHGGGSAGLLLKTAPPDRSALLLRPGLSATDPGGEPAH